MIRITDTGMKMYRGFTLTILLVVWMGTSDGNLSQECTLSLETGPCKGYIPRFGFKDGACQQFIYGGCRGNANNFQTLEDCVQTCQDVCNLPLVTGSCRAYIPRYGARNGRCQEFIYGGCGGNGNNFETNDECIQACG